MRLPRPTGHENMVDRWTKEQQEAAHSIVNDIAEFIDNRETRAELRQALAIYADLLSDERCRLSSMRSDKLLMAVNRLCLNLKSKVK